MRLGSQFKAKLLTRSTYSCIFKVLNRLVRSFARKTFAGLFDLLVIGDTIFAMKQERILILIDGSNFFFKLKDIKLHDLLKFNFDKFAKYLAGSNTIVSAIYYVGRVRQDGTKKADKMAADQQKLFNRLRKHGFRYSLGYLLKNDGVYHEKGVDVQIATDIVVAAYENSCDRVLLISSDTDLMPAIKTAQKKGKIVEYVGFSHMPSVAMVACCKESRLITRDEAGQFIS